MIYAFISYRQFEQKVAACLDASSHFAAYKHLLPSVPWRYRQRFIDTLCMGCDIPASFDILLPSQQLPPVNYTRYAKYAAAKHVALVPQF